MNRIQTALRGVTVAAALAASCLVVPAAGFAQTTGTGRNQLYELNFSLPLPPNRGAPSGRHRGGASRGSCSKYASLAAVVPNLDTDTQQGVWSLTASPHPVFWFDVPDRLTAKTSVEFSLVRVDESETDPGEELETEVYRLTLPGDAIKPGISSLPLTQEVSELEPNQPYRWTMAIFCRDDLLPDVVFVQGTIYRTELEPAFEDKLEAASPLERINLYGEQGFWHEALTELAKLRQENPRDRQLAAAWEKWLKYAKLGDRAAAPIVGEFPIEAGEVELQQDAPL